MPLVSVLVAAHDAAATLGAALESVAAQCHRAWECVVVDDGSKDATPEIVADWAARDPRIRLVSRPHEGVVAARNAGIRTCRGDRIAILDADDRMDPLRLSLQHQALDVEPRLQAVGSHVRYTPRAAMGEGRTAYEAWLNGHRNPADLWRDRFVEMPLAHPTLMLRAPLFRELRYRDMGWPEDWDLLLRLFAEAGAEGIGVVPEVLHHWTLSDGSLSRRSAAFSDAAFTRCRAAFLAEDFLTGRDQYDLVGYGHTGKALRKALRAEGKHCATVFELHPGRIGQVIDGAEVLPQEALAERGPKGGSGKLLVSVSGAQARAILRPRLAGWGYRDGVDFVCTA